ncbi:putative transferase CAF17 homolog, mitochondrial isoform X2 [Gordionus sp. m RMFG-2023]|uniref:putative transferase CAF17 homolog, mitochondrial isoform X2 n=1 Tax=Gordionus sp. m RMFG-2023 TaxID=3053472 RepID=UPI0031FC0F54
MRFHNLLYTLYRLNNRGVFKISGIDNSAFLQGLITNDVNLLSNNSKGVLPAFVLNSQGRVLYDILIYSIPKENQLEFYIECDLSQLVNLKSYILKFKMRKKIDILDETLNVLGYIPKICQESNIQKLKIDYLNYATSVVKKCDSISDIITTQFDPRSLKLGLRMIIKAELDTKLLNNISKPFDKDFEMLPISQYTSYRYRLGIGEGSIDHPVGQCLPLESNADYLNSVSFTKGCYIGQELTSRTYHTGVIRKRLMPIVLEDNSLSDINQPTIPQGIDMYNQNGKKCGVFRNRIGKYGLGLLKIQESLDKKLHIKFDNREITMTTHKPEWWPANDI